MLDGVDLGRYSEAVEYQAEIADWYSTDLAADQLTRLRDLKLNYTPSDTAGADYWLSNPRAMCELISAAARAAETHFVSPEVSDFVYEREHMVPSDIPLSKPMVSARSLFVFWGKPWQTPDKYGYEVKATMVVRILRDDYPGLQDDLANSLLVFMFGGAGNAYVPGLTTTGKPLIISISNWPIGTGWPIEERVDRNPVELYEDDLTEMQRRLLMSLWAFERQKITVEVTHDPDRATRRRLERQNRPYQAVRIVTLRKVEYKRPPKDGTEVPSGRHVSCRYFVGEFMRSQWYPSVKAHYPRLVQEHWRGSGPVRVTRKIFADIR